MNIIKHYIDKDAIIAEIKRRIKEIDEIGTYLSPKGILTNLLCHLDSLEVKEVDLAKEIANQYESNYEDYLTYEEFADIAKHFFELGLKVQKGE